MTIYMKPTQQEREILLRKLKEVVAAREISQADLARATGVDPGQISRILAGDFVTFAGAVVSICKVLGITPDAEGAKTGANTRAGSPPARDLSWSKVERAVKRLWDETPDGADQLVRVLDAIAAVKAPVRRGNVGAETGSVQG